MRLVLLHGRVLWIHGEQCDLAAAVSHATLGMIAAQHSKPASFEAARCVHRDSFAKVAQQTSSHCVPDRLQSLLGFILHGYADRKWSGCVRLGQG